MKAEEARKTALSANLDSTNSEYSLIIAEIKKSSERGRYYCFVHFNINPDVQQKLLEDGFTIKSDQGVYGKILTKIIWQ